MTKEKESTNNKFSEIYVKCEGKLYKFDDAEILVADQDPEEALVEEAKQDANIQAQQEVINQTVAVSQDPAEAVAAVAQEPAIVNNTVTPGAASANAAASASQMVAESIVAPVVTSEDNKEDEVDEKKRGENFNDLYDSLM